MTKTELLLNELPLASKRYKGEIKNVFAKLKKKKPKDLDSFVHTLHDELFSEIDCLACANCCKTLGPRITDI